MYTRAKQQTPPCAAVTELAGRTRCTLLAAPLGTIHAEADVLRRTRADRADSLHVRYSFPRHRELESDSTYLISRASSTGRCNTI